MTNSDDWINDPDLGSHVEELREQFRTGAPEALHRRVEETIASYETQPELGESWLDGSEILAFFEAELREASVRSTPSSVKQSIVYISDPPSGVARRVVLSWSNSHLTIEIEAEPNVGDLWAVVWQLDEPSVARFETDAGGAVRVATALANPRHPARVEIRSAD